ncbi:phosphopantetheine-binding protein [Streptomyces sp. NPDC088190]|uniref:phosphopantetheine-binding protein n=1 Tax=unclassified Streptomyces TaxID=2593676 RepID=UPI002E787EFC|nr:phosphopantetheine-binding protein [Streptomyces sp. JV190]MEE1838778.1 phosphopantetheine-binding protein [Streptomyces sp. JV190]
MNSRCEEASERIVALTEIWRKVLVNPYLDENSDLLEVGGTSIHVLQITGEIHDALRIDVTIRDIFLHASPRSLSDFLEASPKREAASADDINP